jgi:hypothetical protein
VTPLETVARVLARQELAFKHRDLAMVLAETERTWRWHEHEAADILAALAALAERPAAPPWDETRCRICGWPLAASVDQGCVLDSCSLRPLPKTRADGQPWEAERPAGESNQSGSERPGSQPLDLGDEGTSRQDQARLGTQPTTPGPPAEAGPGGVYLEQWILAKLKTMRHYHPPSDDRPPLQEIQGWMHVLSSARDELKDLLPQVDAQSRRLATLLPLARAVMAAAEPIRRELEPHDAVYAYLIAPSQWAALTTALDALAAEVGKETG